jgi:hypothetical protein
MIKKIGLLVIMALLFLLFSMSKALAVMSYLHGHVMFEEIATSKVSNRTG